MTDEEQLGSTRNEVPNEERDEMAKNDHSHTSLEGDIWADRRWCEKNNELIYEVALEHKGSSAHLERDLHPKLHPCLHLPRVMGKGEKRSGVACENRCKKQESQKDSAQGILCALKDGMEVRWRRKNLLWP